jgi:basic membrane protein A
VIAAVSCSRLIGGVFALVASLVLIVVPAGGAKRSAPIKVALVANVAGLNDNGFNALAYKGLQDAQIKLGIDARVFVSKNAGDYARNLTTAATRGFDLVVSVGSPMADATATIAKLFPATKFAIVDVSAPSLKGAPRNVRGILFAENEAGCLAGVAAARVTKTGAIGSVGGAKNPAVDAYIAGYEFCAKRVKPDVEVVRDYGQALSDSRACRKLALAQIKAGADVVFQAGGCGVGVLDAARDRTVWAIASDSDQGSLGGHVLTSAVKGVDVALYQTIRLAGGKGFKGGVDGVYDVKSGASGLGKVSPDAPNRASLVNLLGKWRRSLASGAVKPPRTLA